MADSSNPYQTPLASNAPVETRPAGELIVPGSQKLEVGKCVSGAFEIAKKGWLLLIGGYIIALIVTFVAAVPIGLIAAALGGGAEPGQGSAVGSLVGLIGQLVIQFIGIYFGLGLMAITLDLVDTGKSEIGRLFSQTDKLVPAFLASLILAVAVGIGFVLLVIPGIYLGLRLVHFQTAIVDRGLGPIEALKYSWELTSGNALQLFLLYIVMMVVLLAGLIALGFGLLFAAPLAFIMLVLSYRMLQFGPDYADRHKEQTVFS